MESSKERAAELLRNAKAAQRVNKLEESLQYYQEYLSIMMSLYQIPNINNKELLLKDIEYHMGVAENIKEAIKSSKISNNKAQSSVFNFLGKKSAPKASDNSKVNLNDFHDYNAEARRIREETQKTIVDRLHHGTPTTGSRALNSNTAQQSRPLSTGSAQARSTANSKIVNKLPADPAARKWNEYESQIMLEILDRSPSITWDDIAGLELAKQTLQEAVILPNLRPDLFTGLRSPPKGVLLFGPPGTGKTMLAKAVASESGFCFFSISSSSVTSKYLGEGEKLMKALFDVARAKQPSVIFVDEIDALMSTRKENEHEASRRLKTEFMTQVDGAATNAEERILLMAATNIPWEIDEAVIRRLVKRIYIPLPDSESRKALIRHLLRKQQKAAAPAGEEGQLPLLLTDRQLAKIVKMTDGYSGSDLTALCHEAALGPIRELPPAALRTVKAEDVRPLNETDFSNAVKAVRPSVSQDSIAAFRKWAEQFGTGNR